MRQFISLTAFSLLLLAVSSLSHVPHAVAGPGESLARYGREAEVEQIKRYLSGRKLQISYRNGGPLYGTTYVKEVHLCPSGQYFESGFSERQTVLDNFQRGNWQDHGTWDVVMISGQVCLSSRSLAGGASGYAPIRILPDGRIWLGDEVTVQRMGRAECR